MDIKRINQKDRKAWLRIIESFLAVLIVIGAVLVILSKQEQRADISESVYEKQRYILDIISKNESLRGEIITTSNTQNNSLINGVIQGLVPASWNFATNICRLNETCSNPGNYESKEIFATEVLVTSTLTSYSPKKLRFFVWMK